MWVDDKIGAVHDDVGIGVVVLFGDVLAELSHIANHSWLMEAAMFGQTMGIPSGAAARLTDWWLRQ